MNLPRIMPKTMPRIIPRIMPRTMPRIIPRIMPKTMPRTIPRIMPRWMFTCVSERPRLVATSYRLGLDRYLLS